MKTLYTLLMISLISFTSEPPAQQTPRIGQPQATQEQEIIFLNTTDPDEIERAYARVGLFGFRPRTRHLANDVNDIFEEKNTTNPQN